MMKIKKSTIAFYVTGVLLITIAMWYLNTDFSKSLHDNSQFLIILLLAVFGGIMGFRRLKSAKHGEPVEDELSKRIMQKASSISYFISLYLWIGIMYFDGKKVIETGELFGLGIIGMAIIFALCWTFYNFRGIRNE